MLAAFIAGEADPERLADLTWLVVVLARAVAATLVAALVAVPVVAGRAAGAAVMPVDRARAVAMVAMGRLAVHVAVIVTAGADDAARRRGETEAAE